MSGYEIDDAFAEVMSRRIGETQWAMLEVFLLGEAVLNWITTTTTLGHASPAGTLDYTRPTGDVSADILRDFIAWTSGRKAKAPGCEERIRDEIVASGWAKFCHEKATQHLPPSWPSVAPASRTG